MPEGTNRCGTVLVAVLATLCVACQHEPPFLLTRSLHEVTRWQAFADSTRLGGGVIVDFELDTSGRIVAVDTQGDRLLRYTLQGTYLDSIGREGSGPLEFRGPSQIERVADTLYVNDARNHRIVVLNGEAEFLRLFTRNPQRMLNTISVGPGGYIVSPTRGYVPGGLITVWDSRGHHVGDFGELAHEATMLYDSDLVRDFALRGEAAPFLRNWAQACATSDGGFLVLFDYAGRAQKYDLAGTLLWDRSLEVIEYQELFDLYMADRRTGGPAGRAFFLWLGAFGDDDGGGYLVLNDSRRLTIYHLDSEGSFQERFVGPQVVPRAIRRQGEDFWIYVSSEELFLRLRPE